MNTCSLLVMLKSDSVILCFFFFFKQKTAYDMRISDSSSDVCSSDLVSYAPNFGATGIEAYKQTLDGIGTFFTATSHHVSGVTFDWVNDEIGRASCRERVCQYV